MIFSDFNFFFGSIVKECVKNMFYSKYTLLIYQEFKIHFTFKSKTFLKFVFRIYQSEV